MCPPVLRKECNGQEVHAVSKRIGPSTSTEPGWMANAERLPYYLGMELGRGLNNLQHAVEF
jgi:hypothetical protein